MSTPTPHAQESDRRSRVSSNNTTPRGLKRKHSEELSEPAAPQRRRNRVRVAARQQTRRSTMPSRTTPPSSSNFADPTTQFTFTAEFPRFNSTAPSTTSPQPLSGVLQSVRLLAAMRNDQEIAYRVQDLGARLDTATSSSRQINAEIRDAAEAFINMQSTDPRRGGISSRLSLADISLRVQADERTKIAADVEAILDEVIINETRNTNVAPLEILRHVLHWYESSPGTQQATYQAHDSTRVAGAHIPNRPHRLGALTGSDDDGAADTDPDSTDSDADLDADSDTDYEDPAQVDQVDQVDQMMDGNTDVTTSGVADHV